MEKYRNVHIGKLIRQQIKEKKISVSQFATKINCSRGNVYNIFRAKSIDIDKLIFISSLLNYDFLEEYNLEKSSFKKCKFSESIICPYLKKNNELNI